MSVLYTMYIQSPRIASHPLLDIGFLVTAIGAAKVLYSKPQA